MPRPLAESPRALLERRLSRLWFGDPAEPANRRLATLLAPLSALTGLVAARRRRRIRRLPAGHRPAIVVIGNLVVGGTGKTPAVIALAAELTRRGLRVGLLARGYRAARREPRIVAADADAAEHGDEAVLLARATGLPVAAGERRDAALALLEALDPAPDVVISDDGLQHRRLARSVEVAVFDARGAGNGRLLPAGPLREPLAHAAGMDAVLLNGDASLPQALRAPARAAGVPAFRFDLQPTTLRRLRAAPAAGVPSPRCGTLPRDGIRVEVGDEVADELGADAFARLADGRSVDAIAGIAAPERFFATLRGLGLAIREHPLPDHATITPATLAALTAPLIVMTAKDAVKCRSFADDRCWELGVRARIDPGFVDWLEERLRGPSTA